MNSVCNLYKNKNKCRKTELKSIGRKLLKLLCLNLVVSSSGFAVDKSFLVSGETDCSWRLIFSGGYTKYNNMYDGDGGTGIGRLALSKDFLRSAQVAYGVEVGIQSGNRMRLSVPQDQLDVLGGLPIETTIKPMFDLLAKARYYPFSKNTMFFEAKGGLAYRHWQVDRVTVNDKSQLAGEVQLGVGYPITERTSLILSYQGVFGSNPSFRVNTVAETGHISNIPVEQGALLSLAVAI
ncbi:TPA: hypothetical protein ACTXXA_003326 [Legionella anisa]